MIRDHNGRLRGNPKFGCTGSFCYTGRCETPCDPPPEDLDSFDEAYERYDWDALEGDDDGPIMPKVADPHRF